MHLYTFSLNSLVYSYLTAVAFYKAQVIFLFGAGQSILRQRFNADKRYVVSDTRTRPRARIHELAYTFFKYSRIRRMLFSLYK